MKRSRLKSRDKLWHRYFIRPGLGETEKGAFWPFLQKEKVDAIRKPLKR
jgi:hypothetical protein